MLKQKHKMKRLYAGMSFAGMTVTLLFLLIAATIGNQNTAGVINAASGIIIMILACFTTIVLAYLGLSHHDDLVNGNKDDDKNE